MMALQIFSANAEILDRIVAVVDGKIITLSDERREREFHAILGEKPASAADMLNHLIDAVLIDQEILQFYEIEISDEEVEQRLREIRDFRGMSRSELRDLLIREIRREKYFDLRFREFIRTPDSELQDYYDKVFVPEAQKQGLSPIPPFEQISEKIRQAVVAEKLKEEIEVWLEGLRRRSDIEVFQ